MRFRKTICLILGIFLLLSVFLPAKAAAAQRDAYAAIITASDFQGGDDAFPNFGNMLSVIKEAGCSQPDAFFFGGDYGDSSGVDPTRSTELVMEQVKTVYPSAERDDTIFVQGNHDAADESGEYLTPTGFYEFESFFVYSINEDDYKTKQGTRENYDETVKALAEDVQSSLSLLISRGDTRPVFVTTHVPLHHSSRRSYADTLYAKHLFDVLNELGKELDIIFLFGHNHSSNYDDYIGGSVNYLARGENIRIAHPDTSKQGIHGYAEERLNFTYMNYGYVGYSNNTPTSTSTNVLTTGLIEISPTVITLSRYSENGLYCKEEIQRVRPLTQSPYLSLSGDTQAYVGSSAYLSACISNFTDPICAWKSSNTEIAEIYPAGNHAQILYKTAGTVDFFVEVTDAAGHRFSESLTVAVSPSSIQNPSAGIFSNEKDVSGQSLSLSSAKLGDSLLLEGRVSGYVESPNELFIRWNCTDPSVATVDNGLVTLLSEGMCIITFTASDGKTTLRKTLKLTVSQHPQATGLYRLTDRLEVGGTYIIASSNNLGATIVMSDQGFLTSTDEPRLSAELGVIYLTEGIATLYAANDICEWTAVAPSSEIGDQGFLMKSANGAYLCCNSSGLFCSELTSAQQGLVWRIGDNLHLMSDSGYGPHYVSGSGFRMDDTPKKCYVYEKVGAISYTAKPQASQAASSSENTKWLLPFSFVPSSHLLPIFRH